METIIRRKFEDAERLQAQEVAANAAENNSEYFFSLYLQNPQSFGGRYICSDLFKETFFQYGASKESRNFYNTAVHNSAAVLASEQFKRVILDRNESGDVVYLLTGIPGAGKTTSILSGGWLADNVRAVFEGQLIDKTTTLTKIQQIITAKLKPVIVVIHTLPEIALENTFKRFNTIGRGASINIMTEIQSKLPVTLSFIHEFFGDAVDLHIIDRREIISKDLHGWGFLPVLKSEGDYEQIKQRLMTELEKYRSANIISEECYQQANGEAPKKPTDFISQEVL